MFRISEFSRFTRVSVKALRHYHGLGLLKPAFVDPESGYRHYAARQVRDLQRIVALKEMGFSLEHIRDLLDRGAGSRVMARVLEARRAELERQLELDRRRLDGVVARLREIEDAEPAALPDVVLSALPALRVATRRARVPNLCEGIEELFEALERDAAAAGIRGPGPPLLIYHDRGHPEASADLEVAVPVLADARRAGRSCIRVLDAVPQAACVAYAGDYEQWTHLTSGLLGWLEARRLAPAGPLREVFLQFGVRAPEDLCVPESYLVNRPEDFLTELQIPVVARSGRAAQRRQRGLTRPRRKRGRRPATRMAPKPPLRTPRNPSD